MTTGEDGPGVATIATAVVSIALLALTWLILDARSRGAVDVSQAPATTAPDGRAAAVEAAPADPISEPPLEQAQTRGSLEADAPDWSAALIGIRDSRTAADADTVGRVIESIGEIWFQTDTGEIRRLATAFVDIVYLMEPNEAASLMADLADGIRGNDPSVAAFNAGLLSRLSIERSLATVVDNSVVAAIVSTIGTAQPVGDELFAQGAVRGLQVSARGWPVAAPDERMLQDWTVSADAIGRLDKDASISLVIETLTLLLRSGTDPLDDAAMLRAYETLVSRLDPSTDSSASGFILRMLADPGVDTRSASVLMNALARRGSSGDVAVLPRLSPLASQAERAEVRAALAEIWLGEQSRGNGMESLRTAIREHLRETPGTQPAERVADAIVSARLSNACRLTLWGSDEQAGAVIGTLRDGLDLRRAGRRSPPTPGSGEAWAVRYL
ncbi:MAG: hypothetical protein AAFV43_17185, partial [Planctomycetota bacterium]